jgi:preprotein translocase subunit SecG
MGGQSAFGTKAGDVFTRITIVIAIIWVILAGGSGYLLRAAAEQRGKLFGEGKADSTVTDKAGESGMGTKSGEGAGETDSTTSPAEDAKKSDASDLGTGAAAPTTEKTPAAGDASSKPEATDSTGKAEGATPRPSRDQP